MFVKYSRLFTWAGVLALAATGQSAYGQFCCSPCCCCPPPICVRPAYQTVPVTEYREERRVVQKPVVETKYVDQEVTEYKQVVENKTAEIPTVAYHPVTEYHTVQRDCGHWMTQWHHRPKMAPCQYDCRPDLFGFLNRTQYSVRMAFTPDYYAERVYAPNVVAQQIPVTRQVAVRGTQTVNYQVAKVVPVTSTRRVAVNTVRMVAEEVVTQRPVTVMKIVPFGSTLALGTTPASSSTVTAQQPASSSAETIAIRPKNQPANNAAGGIDRTAKQQPEPPRNDEPEPFDDDDAIRKRGAMKVPTTGDEVAQATGTSGWHATRKTEETVGRWIARKRTEATEGPALPEIIVANNN